MGGGVDIQLVVLSVPDKTPPCFLNGNIAVSVSLKRTTKLILRAKLLKITYLINNLWEIYAILKLCFVFVCLREELVIDLPGDVSPGLHHLPTLLLPHSVGVHPLA